MRILKLDLLRYGKFTDQALSFPNAERDFHLIIGANEAGKSTTRSAILELLYGIETRSTLDFLHAKPEMRLGATIEHDGELLEFIRTKARTKSLISPAGAVVADSLLATFLGGTDRLFFDQMFGLDHAGLQAGGNAILSASNDIGQILFQSAAGIGSLGIVREQLEAEADGLWARRHSKDRSYHLASDELARADAALKVATVRTKDWMEARDCVADLEARREAAHGRYRGFEADRIRLERVRRVAPVLRQLREYRAEAGLLGDVVLLPPDAGQRLAETELELAGAQRDSQLYAGQARQAREKRDLIRVDEHLLKHEADIRALSDRCQQVRNHERDIDRRQLEVAVHWQQVEALVRQIGWPAADEAALAERLPGLPARSAVAGLARQFGVLDQARHAADAALTERKAVLESLDAQLKGLSAVTVPSALRVALTAARALGDLKGSTGRDEALVSKSRRELASAVAALGRWSPDLAFLRGLALPSESDIRLRQKQHAVVQDIRRVVADKHTELNSSINAQALEITQYRNAHHPVSAAELARARAERDAAWLAIKSGEKPVLELAMGFELKLTTADSVSDQRHDKAREVSELQSKLDALERLQLQAAENDARRAATEEVLGAIEADWAQLTVALGLTGLPLQEVEHWRGTRDKSLRADDALTDAQQALDAAQRTAQTAATDLGAAIRAADIAFNPTATFEALKAIAADAVDAATEAKARLDELHKQREAAANALARQTEKTDGTQDAFDAWAAGWRAATSRVGLPETIDAGSAEGALTVIAEIDIKLQNIREIRHARIEAMQRDMRDFEHEVSTMATAVAPDLAEQDPGTAISELAARLAKALDDKKDLDRLRKELETHEGQTAAAGIRVDRARAVLAPLLMLAQVSDYEDLRALIIRSERRRQVEAAVAGAQKAVEESGDGLAPEALEFEVGATEAAQIPVLMADVVRQVEGMRQEQEALTAELTHAKTQLARIAGQGEAARAESERQDALAKMANASERYVKVYTASRLLKWAIDRYRETKQGPMLTRAGEIFRALTLGSFQRLTVDYESEPLTLHGSRADGSLVGIAGMSDGSRDQLYLALRLAALELHLGQGHALPFIADDLFINYDDQRAKAGLEALAKLSEKTQVLFLSHHDHLVPTIEAVFGHGVNVVPL